MAIAYVPYSSIDKKKWDDCIFNAANGLVYATSIYLDTMSDNWDALVMDDYKAVMPLTWRKKYGIHYLYQPFFTACLGVFAQQVNAQLLHDFLKAVPARFRYWDISLNHGNFFQLPGFDLYQRMNYVLPLDGPYEKLHENFRDNIKRNIKKAARLNCVIKKDIPVDDVISLARDQLKDSALLTKNDFTRFTKLYQQLLAEKQAITYAVYSSLNELLASGVFFFYKNRAYYILVGNHPNGKTLGASHALINAFIKDHAGQHMLLDFEGSDIRNLAFFYSSFGAAEEKYAGLKYNNLPRLLKYFKK